MRVTLLGHASALAELDGATCLMDPVLADPFEEGTVASCPNRMTVGVELSAKHEVDHELRQLNLGTGRRG